VTVAITGASGQLGTSTVKFLLERMNPADVVAISRDPSKLDAFARKGAQVRAGDFAKPESLAEAFKGVEKLLIIPTSDLQPGVRGPQHLAAIKAAAAAGVSHAVYISMAGVHPHSPDIIESHFTTEQALIASGMKWTLIRMNLFAENFLHSAAQVIASGVYATTSGAPVAYVARDDIARLAAAVLATPGHDYMTYHPTGPLAVTATDIADSLSPMVGKPIKAVEITDEQFRQGAAAAGLPGVYIDALVALGEATRKGVFDLVSGDIGRVTGRDAESMFEFLARNKALLAKAA
jgi:NAD(P)H dehydrogenase (quinone)